MVKAADEFPGGTLLHKELQGFEAFIAYENVSFRNGTVMTQTLQSQCMATCYGDDVKDDDSVGLCQQLVNCSAISAHLYDTEEMSQQTSSQSSTNGHTRYTLVLKPHLHLIPSTKVVVSSQPNKISLALLQSLSSKAR